MLALLVLATLDCPADVAKAKYLVWTSAAKPLACYKSLEHLDASDRGWTDLSPLAAVPTLKKLQVAKNKVRDLTPLATLTSLEEIDLGENEVASLAPLAGLTRLRVLKLMRNRIEDLSPLRNLTALEELWLYDNRVRDVSPLVGLKKLRQWEFERNAITNLQLLRDAGIPVSVNSQQYRGSCADVLRQIKAKQPVAKDVYAICPVWEDDRARSLVRRIPPHCRAERICGDVLGIDCHSAADGAYDYVDLFTHEIISRCGGHCLSNEGCKDCPPKRMHCAP